MAYTFEVGLGWARPWAFGSFQIAETDSSRFATANAGR